MSMPHIRLMMALLNVVGLYRGCHVAGIVKFSYSDSALHVELQATGMDSKWRTMLAIFLSKPLDNWSSKPSL